MLNKPSPVPRFLCWTGVFAIGLVLSGCGKGKNPTTGQSGAPRDLYSDTWVGTDALGRNLPVSGEVRAPQESKQVGIFYLTWHGAHGYGGADPMRADQGVVQKSQKYYLSPYNLSKAFAENPTNPILGNPGEFHHWGEPEMGYYVDDDPYVIRKHAEMLADAGVDFLFMDTTNGFHYKGVYEVIFAEFEKLKSEGRQVPKFAFFTHSHCDYKKLISFLYEDIYKPGRFKDLWFEWDGKPLILAPNEGIPDEIRDFFTWRRSWAWTRGAEWFGEGKDKWPWMDNTPQNFGWHEAPNIPEQITVAVAQHPTSNIGRSHQGNVQPPRDKAQPERGLYFEEQWRRAHEVDPPVTMITGWNEWVAQRFIADGTTNPMFGKIAPAGAPFFVDLYDEEFNRDIEPMKGGSTDSLYCQMVGHIRQMKGARPIPPAGKPKTIKIDGSANDWEDVTPEFRDHAFDTTHRDHMGWGRVNRYVNTTGRNDIVAAKVSRDAGHVFFLAQTREPLTPATDPNWMLLFIDADRDPKTGWEGFDFAVNMEVLSDKETTLKKAVRKDDGTFTWETVARIPFCSKDKNLELAIPADLLGWHEDASGGFDFKWADNPQKLNDIAEFSISGDAAPSRRFKYRYAIQPNTPSAER